MWGKNTTKTCALLRTLWKRLIQNFDTELPCSPRLFKPLREIGWWKSSHRQVYNGSPEAAHGQIQRKGFLGAYLGGRKEQPQPASGAWVCSAATPTINSSQPLVPPDPAVPCPGQNQVRAPWHHKWTWGAPCQPSPFGMGQGGGFLRGTYREARRITKNWIVTLTSA